MCENPAKKLLDLTCLLPWVTTSYKGVAVVENTAIYALKRTIAFQIALRDSIDI